MNTYAEAAPAGLRVARWYLAAIAALVLGIAAVTILNYVGLAMSGTTLVFSQEDMGAGGPGPAPAPAEGEPQPAIPADQATGSSQFVDVPGLALTIGAGAVVAAGAVALFRRSRWSVPLGLGASAVAAGVGLLPAAIGVWAMNYYAIVDFADVAPLFAISAALLSAALFCAVAIWRSRPAPVPA